MSGGSGGPVGRLPAPEADTDDHSFVEADPVALPAEAPPLASAAETPADAAPGNERKEDPTESLGDTTPIDDTLDEDDERLEELAG